MIESTGLEPRTGTRSFWGTAYLENRWELLAGFGYWQLMQKSTGLFWLTYAIPVLHLAVISGRVWDWPAGPAWGPRLLSPMLPLLALPCAYGVSRFPWLGLPLAAYSILVTSVATLTDACPPYDVHLNPLLELNVPAFWKGELSPNLGMLLGLSAHASAALYFAVMIVGGIWLWRSLKATVDGPRAGRVGTRGNSALRSPSSFPLSRLDLHPANLGTRLDPCAHAQIQWPL